MHFNLWYHNLFAVLIFDETGNVKQDIAMRRSGGPGGNQDTDRDTVRERKRNNPHRIFLTSTMLKAITSQQGRPDVLTVQDASGERLLQ